MSILRRADGGERWDFDRAFDEAGLGSPFPRSISFGDVDAEATISGFEPEDQADPNAVFETEMSGEFLVVEGKRTGECLSTGQRKTMDARVATGRTCVVVYGEPPTGIKEFQVWGDEIRPASARSFWNFCRAWAEWADQQLFRGEPNAFVTALIDTFVAARSQPSLPPGWSIRLEHNRDGSWTAFVDDEAHDYAHCFGHAFTKSRATEIALKQVERRRRIAAAPQTDSAPSQGDWLDELQVDWPETA